ncbi:hypothetical protein EDF62_3068 [Leucobacter luti]|uniref:Uncharacterized protein n=1 Tax=Leucobacter luti TaxID=340320 RepID=A0A4R6RSE3_9MICO|nr:hypothetical protein [Leucobacter luti]TDP89771.1 hypothetical protein EDF62_3068 [Leucobacter luti]
MSAHDRYERDDYTGDWWNDHPGSEEILSRIQAVERQRLAGGFRSQIDYHAAFWDAEGITPPGDRERVSIARAGLSTAAPLAINENRFTALRAEAPEWAVGHDALITLNAQRLPGKKAPRWNSRHPIIEALTTGEIDSAITLNGLATTGSVTIPMTSKTLDTIYVRPELLHHVQLSWQCLRLRHKDIITLPSQHEIMRVDEPWFREPWRWLLPAYEDAVQDADTALELELTMLESP